MAKATKDIYIDFKDGDIQGDSHDEAHPGWVEVGAFEQKIVSSEACDESSKRIEFGHLIFSKDVDRSTPALMRACTSGAVIRDVEVHFCRANGGACEDDIPRRKYYRLKLQDAIVSSITTVLGGDGVPVERFTLKYFSMSWFFE